jgi:dethiobiotin synthetase
VVCHYLGSIITLLTIEALQNRKINVAGIIFSGEEQSDRIDHFIQNRN